VEDNKFYRPPSTNRAERLGQPLQPVQRAD
jgi:hypothetical protein